MLLDDRKSKAEGGTLAEEKYSMNGGGLTGIWLAGRSAFINMIIHQGGDFQRDDIWDGTQAQLMEFVKNFDPAGLGSCARLFQAGVASTRSLHHI